MHALIVGVTGATGSDVLDQLLADSACTRVDVFVRRPFDRQHTKLHVHQINFDAPAEWQHLVQGDVLFSCLGTTLKVAGSKEAQWKIDYDYQYNFAKAARENGVASYVLVSADGASARSPIFYSKMKGQLEDAVQALGFQNVIIFNPPILERKNTDRSGEVTGIRVINFLNRFGILRSQKPLRTEILAQAMINCAKVKASGVLKLKGAEIWRRAGLEQ
ncbi:MAG: NAD(P)H-binding protein [Gemmatimonas sp.]